jgi:hypothetical protein
MTDFLVSDRCASWFFRALLSHVPVSGVLGMLTATCLAFSANAGEPAAACEQAGVAVYRDFDGAAFESCDFSDSGVLRIRVAPEDTPINPSPWFAFRVVSAGSGPQQVELDYGEVKHRYLPDLSYDGEQWEVFSESQLQLTEDGTRASFNLALTQDKPVYVAAQPVLPGAAYKTWAERLQADHALNIREVGRTPQDRPLWRLATPARSRTLLLIGRQHPPETTGALAMFAFVERLLDSDALATAFREEVGFVLYPLLNPDGVARGHWRHNTGGQDLNRDWGPFTQAETRLVAEDVDVFLATHASTLTKSIDFHSTWYEVFYTQDDDTAQVAPGLLRAWMQDFESSMSARAPDFSLNRKTSHNADRPTAKSYFFERYGVASTTLEIGDATDPAYITEYATVAAESLMRAWLAGAY